MNTGKTLFAQLMDFLPWTTFTRIVDRYGGDHRVRTLSCAERYRSMAFAQLTYRESLRDIETCLSVHASKLYHMGFRQPVRRSTLADANERRDWRIHAALAQRLITQARTLYVDEELGLDLTNTVYALDSTTIALCLSVFPWAHFRTTKAAVKMHTLLDLRGNIPSFIHISDGKLHDVHALDMLLPEAGAIYVVDRGYVDFARLYVLHQAGAFFVTRAKSNIDAHRVYSAPTDRSTGIICDQTISLDGFYTRQDYPELLRRIRFKDPESGKTLVFITNNLSLPAATICALYKSRWQVELFFKWIKQHLRIKQFYGTSENAVKTQIWIAVSVYALVAIVKKRLDLDASLYTLLQILSVTLFEKMPIHQALAGDETYHPSISPDFPEERDGDESLDAGLDAADAAFEQRCQAAQQVAGSLVRRFFSAGVALLTTSHMPTDTAQKSASAMTRMRRSKRSVRWMWLSSMPKPRVLKSENMGSMPHRSP